MKQNCSEGTDAQGEGENVSKLRGTATLSGRNETLEKKETEGSRDSSFRNRENDAPRNGGPPDRLNCLGRS